MSTQFENSVGISSANHSDSAESSKQVEEPIIVGEFYRADENGKMRKFIRTRNGRELRMLDPNDEDDVKYFEKHFPYDPDL